MAQRALTTRIVSRCYIIGYVVALAAVILAVPATVWTEPRLPQVAGSFYPDDPKELQGLLSELLKAARPSLAAGKPRILIAPHAGYAYSGPVAASVFRTLQGHQYDGVVVVGFTHQQRFRGASVDMREAYQTPLGMIPVDTDAAEFLRGQHESLGFREEAHAASEHSLEVMLPFLQEVLGDFKLVPVLMGTASPTDAEALAEALAGLAARGDYLFIFSTDLSHYHPYEEAVLIDQRVMDAIAFESPQAVHRLFEAGQLEACGRGPIVTSLFLAGQLGYPTREVLHYANSGDTAGDTHRVVGYAAIAMFDQAKPAAHLLSEEAGMALVRAARSTLEHALLHDEDPEPLSIEEYPELARTNGAFVTLRKNGLLCGCIGSIEGGEPLATSVPLVALDAALRDGRFAPVTGEDLKNIHVEVSVLTPLTRLERLDDLVPGRDGVVLKASGRSGVFLPSVWTSTGWTRREFLRELASQKAGLPPEAWRTATLYVFQDQVFEEELPE